MSVGEVSGRAGARAAATLLLLIGGGCEGARSEYVLHLEGRALGTGWRAEIVLGETPDPGRVSGLRAAIEAVLDRVDRGMSTWREDSEIARFNRDGDASVALSAETRRVVGAALDMARDSGGAFDPTVGPLVALWGFGAHAATRAPGQGELARARSRVGWQKLEWDESGRLVRRAPGVELDLSALAKGYAVDAVVAELGAARSSGLLVEIGGEVRTSGAKPGGLPWRVGIERPEAEALEEVVELRGVALATSGDYRQQRLVDGRRVTHVIDPRTGRPVDRGVASASVIAPTCMEADAVATALMVLGSDAGLAWVEERPWLDAMLLVREGDGELRRVSSSGWGRWRAGEE